MEATVFQVVPLLEEALLPGEERVLGAPALDAAAMRALREVGGKPCCTVTVSNLSEMPTLVAGRWGTQCAVVDATDTTVTLRGGARVKLVSVKGLQVPYTANAEVHATHPTTPELAAGLVPGLQALLTALHGGALPQRAGWQDEFMAAAAALARALSGQAELTVLLQEPLAQSLGRLAATLQGRTPGERASITLEEMRAQIPSDRATMPRDLRQRLWDQTVEILRTLDVYDTTTGSDESDLVAVQRRLQQAGLPKEPRDLAKRELRLMRSMETRHHDYPTYRGHLDFMARLPWHVETVPSPDLVRVAAVLDRDHTGLEKPKRRILEYLAVKTLGGKTRSTVLCLAGPPGVGKTTLARAVAEALGRRFVRVALGGVHDESEIRGHRLTYVAASPGRILNALATVGSCAPVMLLDELDKIGTDRMRSPVGALHELLDPEQNTHFHDNYLGVPFDLSHVLFIATANDLSQVNPTLLDRLEVVELDGYLASEKVGIARNQLLAAVQRESGLPGNLALDPDALDAIIEQHTREAGVRQLRRHLDALFRGRALRHVQGAGPAALAPITAAEVREVLGPPRHPRAAMGEHLPPGAAWGLSVAGDGGALMRVEAALYAGRAKVRLTGSAGNVLRESVQTVLAHLQVAASAYGAEVTAFQQGVHVHLPEAAVPKDGPSAGVAVAMALVSAALRRPLPTTVAMTGELSLHGDVLPVGGVRAKVLAAERAGATRVLVPTQNAADVPPGVRLEVALVANLAEAWKLMA